MTPRSILALLTLLCASTYAAPPDEFPLTEDSKVHDGVAKGELIKDKHVAKDGSVFPGTEREYAVYVPAGLDKTKPAPFMVFQDGVIYNAPTVFDNFIARKEIPAMIGIFIKPGVVPAANDNALPRYNRSYEYDSVTDSYARFLIDEFLPAIKAKHGLNLSDDPNARGIAGNSSGGICAFMVAWHRPDQFRRVFTGVGTYVGIHGADQLPVLVRKFEPKPLRVFLQSGENDNDLYCGDWWLANQMMERSLSWNGYEVNHAWGTGGHNAKHATQIFPEVLRWLWKGYPNEPLKANPRGDAKWVGSTVIGEGEWVMAHQEKTPEHEAQVLQDRLAAMLDGSVFIAKYRGETKDTSSVLRIDASGKTTTIHIACESIANLTTGPDGTLRVFAPSNSQPGKHSSVLSVTPDGKITAKHDIIVKDGYYDVSHANAMCCAHDGRVFFSDWGNALIGWLTPDGKYHYFHNESSETDMGSASSICLTPDQTQLYLEHVVGEATIAMFKLNEKAPELSFGEYFNKLDTFPPQGDKWPSQISGMCVDTNGWLYVATSLGIQVLDQAGRVNFIIPTPKQPHDVCFGGKDLSDLFIACGDMIYKCKTKAHGYISGQMAPIKPPAPKL